MSYVCALASGFRRFDATVPTFPLTTIITMSLGDNPLLKKSKSTRNLTGTRLSGSFSHAFSATQQNSLNSRMQVQSPFSKLVNSNAPFQLKADRSESYQSGFSSGQASALDEARLGSASVEDSRSSRSFPSFHTNAFVAGSQTIQTRDDTNNGKPTLSQSPQDLQYQPEPKLKMEYDGFSSPSLSSFLRDKRDYVTADCRQGGSRYSSILSQMHPMPIAVEEDSQKGLNAVNRDALDVISSVDRRGSHSSAIQEETTGDLSALMIKGATDLRLAKVALDQKVCPGASPSVGMLM